MSLRLRGAQQRSTIVRTVPHATCGLQRATSYIYTYIYMCVCVCAACNLRPAACNVAQARNALSRRRALFRHALRRHIPPPAAPADLADTPTRSATTRCASMRRYRLRAALPKRRRLRYGAGRPASPIHAHCCNVVRRAATLVRAAPHRALCATPMRRQTAPADRCRRRNTTCRRRELP